MSNAISISGLVKNFGHVRALGRPGGNGCQVAEDHGIEVLSVERLTLDVPRLELLVRLVERLRGRIVASRDFTDDRGFGIDEHGHGTHVAGIAAAAGRTAADDTRGMAPGAHLLSLRVLDAKGRGYAADVTEALALVLGEEADTADDADGEVVLLMGIQGAGKTEHAQALLAHGYERLNRDQRGGRLSGLNRALDEGLGAGKRRWVLDNTYRSLASRARVVECAWRHGVPARCIWLDTPLADAQINAVRRLRARYGV